MARYVRKQRRKERIRHRVETGAYDFFDSYGEIPGTSIEKIVYNELMRRGIPFEFQKYVNFMIPDIEVNRWHRADFVLQAERIIINPLGSYWHMQPATIEKDSTVAALAQATGWTYLFWWDYEIKSKLVQLFDAVPALGMRSAGPLQVAPRNEAGKNDIKGIQTLNRKRARLYKKPPTKYKVKGMRRKKLPGYTLV